MSGLLHFGVDSRWRYGEAYTRRPGGRPPETPPYARACAPSGGGLTQKEVTRWSSLPRCTPREESDKAFHVEQHVINFVPENERWAKPRDLFVMWAGASFQIEYFVYGVILMAFFGLYFAQVVLLIVLGNLSFVLLGIASLQGPQAGTTAMTITRASYGPERPAGDLVVQLAHPGGLRDRGPRPRGVRRCGGSSR